MLLEVRMRCRLQKSGIKIKFEVCIEIFGGIMERG